MATTSKNVETESRKIIPKEISIIHLDPKNPRLPRKISEEANEKDIANWILENGNLLELMVSIAENGYFDGEPILVIPDKKHQDEFIVIEGNRRLTAMKILNKPSLARKKENTIREIIKNAKSPISDKIPVIIYDNEEDTLDYLGFRHITGIKQWSPLAKAIYLDKLFKARKGVKEIDERYRVLAKIIGSRPSHVKRMHTTYRIYEIIEARKFYKIPGVNEDAIEFSNLNDALTKFQFISAYVKLNFENKDPLPVDEKRLKELLIWMFYKDTKTGEARIGEVRDLAKLNVILNPKNKFAYESFMKGDSIEKAFGLTDEPKKIFSNSLSEAFENLNVAQQLLYSIEDPTKEDAELLKKINEFSFDLYNSVSARLNPVKKVK